MSLLTLGPGQELYERFAHNAIMVHDPTARDPYRDVAFNYGLFSFGDSFLTEFLPQFIRGSMKYQMAPMDAFPSIEQYRRENRDVTVQRLRLTPVQAARLNDFLWNNAQPENRHYVYNYYTDNCSTRVRDALDGAVDGQIRKQTANLPTPRTFRYHTLRTLASNLPAYIGVDFAMGQRTDRPISRWDEMFLPVYLQRYLRQVTVQTPDGATVPLVSSEQVLATSTREPVPDEPPHWRAYFLLAGLSLSAMLIALHAMSVRWRPARWALWALVLAWTLLTAFAGGFLLFMWCLTNHWATYDNENFLQMPPIAILTILVLLTSLVRKRTPDAAKRRARRLFALTLLTAVCSMVGLLLKALPRFYQDNWSIILWVLPVHIALAIIFHRRTQSPVTEPLAEKP